MLGFLVDIVEVAEVCNLHLLTLSIIDANILLSLTLVSHWQKHFRRCLCDLGSKTRFVQTLVDFIVLTIVQILALNADNATSNDTQTGALAFMENAFEEANRACCFNHMLQLSAKTLLKPFNAGMSPTNPALEEEESGDLNNEILMLLNKDAVGDDEMDGDEDSDEEVHGGEDLDDGDKPDDADSEEPDELNQLDDQEWERVLADTLLVRQTVTKVCFDPF